MQKPDVLIVGAGINGLVAANYLQKSGCNVTMVDRAYRVGGACVSEQMSYGNVTESYALGASVLGLMQDFVFEETGLAHNLDTFVPTHPKLIHFPNDSMVTKIHRNPEDLDQELANKWGEKGDVKGFRYDEGRVIEFLQQGYREACPPTLEAANNKLGKVLTNLWITGDAKTLLDHYFTSERSKMYMAMTVSESGPVSLKDPYSAFTLPVMDSGSVFGGYYGHVKGGIWKITETLGRINRELGVKTHLSSQVMEVDSKKGRVFLISNDEEKYIDFDYLILGTDPLTAHKLVGNDCEIKNAEDKKYLGSSGKLNMMFKNPIQWKDATDLSDTDAAFRFIFGVETLDEFENATLKVTDPDFHYVPGYMQIYCEGGAQRQMQVNESFDRLAVFFKNFSLSKKGDELPHVEEEVKQKILQYVNNPEDCIWTRLLTPRDLQSLFYFPGGNLDHTMLTGGQTYFDRNFSSDPENHFYRFTDKENVYLCGAGTYPCGSVAGTPGYMCSQQLIKAIN
jgi:phytoene dehydrogenase-like protein